MNSNSQNSLPNSESAPSLGSHRSATGEDTLRLIAGLPAPQGLENRVHQALRTAPPPGRVLAWPLLRADSSWLRAAAAAAIVTIVAGGGWGVYSHIQPWQAVKTPLPAKLGSSSGFSNAEAKRTPQTLQLPVVAVAPKSNAAHKKARKTAEQATHTATSAPAK